MTEDKKKKKKGDAPPAEGSLNTNSDTDDGEKDAPDEATPTNVGKSDVNGPSTPEEVNPALLETADAEETEDERAQGQPDPFSDFVTTLKERDPELANLERPAKKDAVDQAEAALGTTFPPAFREFLLRWNGGTAHEICIYGVGTGDEYDIVDLNERIRGDDFPEHLLGFAATVQGEVYCFDTSRKNGSGESPIVLVDGEENRQFEAANEFMGWLEKLPVLEQELADQRGPQPMTVAEWEAFVTREREKLRRLSKTPARDLPMPDPETARADLGGKIPVDPRHLKPRGGN